jgi:hypothetical protein
MKYWPQGQQDRREGAQQSMDMMYQSAGPIADVITQGSVGAQSQIQAGLQQQQNALMGMPTDPNALQPISINPDMSWLQQTLPETNLTVGQQQPQPQQPQQPQNPGSNTPIPPIIPQPQIDANRNGGGGAGSNWRGDFPFVPNNGGPQSDNGLPPGPNAGNGAYGPGPWANGGRPPGPGIPGAYYGSGNSGPGFDVGNPFDFGFPDLGGTPGWNGNDSSYPDWIPNGGGTGNIGNILGGITSGTSGSTGSGSGGGGSFLDFLGTIFGWGNDDQSKGPYGK